MIESRAVIDLREKDLIWKCADLIYNYLIDLQLHDLICDLS